MPICEYCHGSGRFAANESLPCPWCRPREHLLQHTQLVIRGRIGSEFQDKTLESYERRSKDSADALATVRNYLEHAKIHRGAGHSLLLGGVYGTGKTHLAVALFRELRLLLQPCQWLSESELIAQIGKAYRDSQSNGTAILPGPPYLSKLGREGFIFVDEIGKNQPEANIFSFERRTWASIFGDILDWWYRHNVPIVITTNYSLHGYDLDGEHVEGLDERYGADSPRLADRIVSMVQDRAVEIRDSESMRGMGDS